MYVLFDKSHYNLNMNACYDTMYNYKYVLRFSAFGLICFVLNCSVTVNSGESISTPTHVNTNLCAHEQARTHIHPDIMARPPVVSSCIKCCLSAPPLKAQPSLTAADWDRYTHTHTLRHAHTRYRCVFRWLVLHRRTWSFRPRPPHRRLTYSNWSIDAKFCYVVF